MGFNLHRPTIYASSLVSSDDVSFSGSMASAALRIPRPSPATMAAAAAAVPRSSLIAAVT